MTPQSMTHKILAKQAGLDAVDSGQHIDANVNMCFAHDPVMSILTKTFYANFGLETKVWNPDRVALFQDHLVPAKDLEARNLAMIMDQFAKDQGIKNYFPYGKNYGVCHIVMLEQGLALPGELIVGTDSHTVTYGAFNSFATGVGMFDLANVLRTGKLWFTVPEVIRVTVNGELPKGVYAKDIILSLIGDIKMDGASSKTIEWAGSTIDNMNVDERTTLCNMAVEAGATNGIMKLNAAARDYMKSVSQAPFEEVESDEDYIYAQELTYQAEEITPKVAVPHQPDNVYPIEEVKKSRIKVNQVYVGGCTGGKIEDIKIFTEVVRGKKFAPSVQVIVVPATMNIYEHIAKNGIMSDLISAGAVIESPGCKACYGAHGGVTGDNEVCLATINRNFIGRMGNPNSRIYLSSPYIAGTSALAGEITDGVSHGI